MMLSESAREKEHFCKLQKTLNSKTRIAFKRKVYFNLHVSEKQMKVCKINTFQNSYYDFNFSGSALCS